MSRRISKIEEENQKLRSELKKLKFEIKNLKKVSNFNTISSKQKIIFKVQEQLELGIFSPPKLPSRSRSPMSSKSRKSSRSPSFQSTSTFDLNKENFKTFESKSKGQELSVVSVSSKEPLTEHISSLNDTSRQNIDELQTLERENKMLKELDHLRKENKLLRSQIKLKTPKRAKNSSRNSKVRIKKNSQESFRTSKSPKRGFHKHSFSMISPSPSVKNIERSPSMRSKSPTSFYDNFSFTGSSRKESERSREYLDMPRKVERSPGLCSSRFSPIATPRSKNCSNCDHLLYKGLSTSFCSKRHDE